MNCIAIRQSSCKLEVVLRQVHTRMPLRGLSLMHTRNFVSRVVVTTAASPFGFGEVQISSVVYSYSLTPDGLRWRSCLKTIVPA